MINPFKLFVDFSNYLGMWKAALMVVIFFLGTWLLSSLPEKLAKSESKISKVFMKKITK